MQPDRETCLHNLPTLTLRVPVPKTERTTMVSFILFSLAGAQGTGPRPAMLLDHLRGTIVLIQILFHQVGQVAPGIICLVVGMKTLTNVMFGCSLPLFL